MDLLWKVGGAMRAGGRFRKAIAYDREVKMSEQKIAVPEGMYQAALKFQDSGIQCEAALRAALEWLAENPVIPTDEQITDFYGYESEAGVSYQFLQRFAKWFQVRMFLAPPGPEMPAFIECDTCRAKPGCALSLCWVPAQPARD